MRHRTLLLGCLFVATGTATTVGLGGCKDRTAPVTPESASTAAGKQLPAPTGTAGSVTGTPTGAAPLELPPVTQVPGTPVGSAPTTPVAVVQPLPTAGAPRPAANAPVAPAPGGVAAVIEPDSVAEPTVEDAKHVIEDYYAAVNRGAYDAAWRLWANGGRASGKTASEFANGYADTSSVSVSLGDPGPVDAGAGQRHIQIPVRIIARQRDQSTKEYTGTYTLGRSVVDGATPAQRAWRIRSANIDTANR